jgi:hypothetical protein
VRADDNAVSMIDLYALFNAQIGAMPRTEVNLFRLLGRIIQSAGAGIYVEELHGTRGQVTFQSGIWPHKSWQREICDLAIVSHSASRGQTRLTMHQCKLERDHACPRLDPDLRFKADLGQYDLLHYRPDFHSVGSVHLPENLLSSTPYASIGSYGIFYRDAMDRIDYAYGGARWLTPITPREHTQLSLPYALNGVHNTIAGTDGELVSQHGMTAVFRAFASLEIGSPVQRHSAQAQYIGAMLRRAQVMPPLRSETLVPSLMRSLGDTGNLDDIGRFRLLLIDGDASAQIDFG